ncbi:MAG: hypothetical protein JWR61_1535 [Ferruginibacter sp.]|uniref:OsmC family protein n=1 Tax=Ferruginibacter sp. TaxID=1940288 RepID=UPI00265B3E3B|nr:OsmC family protein [Ferruginibacter sp.]MDB5276580.1 hypothetical protein [Ferruginibacter sp.]
MAKVTTNNGKENYLMEIQTPSGIKVVADEPIEKGGQDKGFSPKELLVAALAACTNATVRMYCNRKGWELKNINPDGNFQGFYYLIKEEVFRAGHTGSIKQNIS